MSKSGWIALVATAWIASLAAVGLWAQVLTPTDPKVMSGGDIGFRVERMDRGTPVGRLVVRVNGQWVEASFASGISRVGTR